MPATAPRMDAAALEEFLRTEFPQIDASVFRIEEVAPMSVRIRFHASERHLRPGRTVSGPALMMLADTAMYLAVLAMAGPVAQAVTTSLNIHFLRRPPAGELDAGRLRQAGIFVGGVPGAPLRLRPGARGRGGGPRGDPERARGPRPGTGALRAHARRGDPAGLADRGIARATDRRSRAHSEEFRTLPALSRPGYLHLWPLPMRSLNAPPYATADRPLAGRCRSTEPPPRPA